MGRKTIKDGFRLEPTSFSNIVNNHQHKSLPCFAQKLLVPDRFPFVKKVLDGTWSKDTQGYIFTLSEQGKKDFRACRSQLENFFG